MRQEKKEKERNEQNPFWHEWLFQFDNWLRQLAARLQAGTARYSYQKMKRLLVAFCLLILGLSSYIIIESVEGKSTSLNITSIHTLSIPKSPRVTPVIGEKEGARIHRYKRYLDSLSVVQGKVAFLDSFNAIHPRLIDTLNFLEKIYQQQLKTNTYEK